jgi:hypothetical protein
MRVTADSIVLARNQKAALTLVAGSYVMGSRTCLMKIPVSKLYPFCFRAI